MAERHKKPIFKSFLQCIKKILSKFYRLHGWQ